MQKGWLDAKELAEYIIRKYQEEFDKEISMVKLQRGLYFMFAFWGGYITKNERAKIKEIETGLNPILFTNTIEAWPYGGAVPEVNTYYKKRQEGLIGPERMDYNYSIADKVIHSNDILQDVLEDLMHDIFNTSDFKLVSRAHNDDCWKNHIDFEDESDILQEIPKQEIIEEYTKKEM